MIAHGQAPAFIMLNTDKAPLNNLDLRLALEYATNQQQINQTILLGLGSAATGPYATGNQWYVDSGYPTSPDLSKARQYIQDYLNQTHTKLPIKFTLGCTPVSTYEQAMSLIAAQWQQIGVQVNQTTTEQATYINDAVFGNYQANCWTQFGAIDPDLDSTWWLSSNARGSVTLNFARLVDPVTDQALLQARQTANVAQRKALYGKVWKQFTAQAPYIWINRGPDMMIWSPKLHGIGDGTLPDGSKAYPLEQGATEPNVAQLWLSS
jgi:peptide/nickel transport system substrate-binding protein